MPSPEMSAAHLSEGQHGQSVGDHLVNSSETAASSSFASSPDERVGPAHLGRHGLAPASLTTYTPLDTCLAQPFPLPTTTNADLLETPYDQRPDFSIDFAASVLPLADVSLPSPPIVRNIHKLRLPSFDVLGIANPRPDRIPLAANNSFTNSFSPIGAGPLSNPEDPLHALSPKLGRPQQLPGEEQFLEPDRYEFEPLSSSPEAARAHVERQVPTWTPPSEPGTINWGTFVRVRGVGSPPCSPSDGLDSTANSSSAANGNPSTAPAPTTTISVAELGDSLGMALWVNRVKEIITSNFQSVHPDSVKVLSHALPCPSMTGHLFGEIILGIHEKTTTPTAWVNVFHAVPGRFTLSELPKSPPSTPGPAVGGDEYFTSKVFDSAVAVPDYQLASHLLPPSPRPVVPPGSVNVSIVERYIPPTNSNEFDEMFNLNGRSLLYDRLTELCSANGLLLFIYPTKTGARTFMRDYLSPVLDPLLRTVTVVHDLSSDLGKAVGHMSSVEHLSEYDNLHAEMVRFCNRLSEGPSSLSVSPERRATYTIIHAAKEGIVLPREAWASDWWIKQEKSRVRELVTKYFRKKLPSSELTPTNLIQEILDGVAHRVNESRRGPREVEVGTFIIKKSTC